MYILTDGKNYVINYSSTLCQSFEKDEPLYNQFIFDLEVSDHYDILICDSSDDYYGICKANVYFYETPCEKNNYETELNYKYEIDFIYNECNYGYCECTSSDPDYREDKSNNFYDFSIEDFSLENYNPIKPNLVLPLGI